LRQGAATGGVTIMTVLDTSNLEAMLAELGTSMRPTRRP
jgi:hypothetical protein